MGRCPVPHALEGVDTQLHHGWFVGDVVAQVGTLTGEVAEAGKAVVEDLSGRQVSADLIDVGSLMIVPIRRGEEFVGSILADRNGEPFRLNQGELDLAQAMANIAALRLDNARTREMAGVS